MAKISLDPLAPNTAFILGAALAGGDPIAAAKMFTPCDGTGDCNESPCPHEEKERGDANDQHLHLCTHVGADGERCTDTEGHEEFSSHTSHCQNPDCCAPGEP